MAPMGDDGKSMVCDNVVHISHERFGCIPNHCTLAIIMDTRAAYASSPLANPYILVLYRRAGTGKSTVSTLVPAALHQSFFARSFFIRIFRIDRNSISMRDMVRSA